MTGYCVGNDGCDVGNDGCDVGKTGTVIAGLTGYLRGSDSKSSTLKLAG